MRKLIEPLYKKLDNLEQGQAQIKTTVEVLAAGQQDIREYMAAKHDVERLEKGQGDIKATVQDGGAKLVKRVNSHEERVDDLENEAGLPNSHKN
jgi:hypothetical protein